MCAAPKKKTARKIAKKSSKKAAKKKSSNAGRKAGVSDCVYITRSLFGKVCEHLGGDHRDKNFKVSRKWLESLGYDLLEVKRKDPLSYAEAVKAEESRGRVNDSNLHRLGGDTSPRKKLGRGEQSGSTHVYVPAAALLNLLDDRKRYERAHEIFEGKGNGAAENLFLPKDAKLILKWKRSVESEAESKAKLNGEDVVESVGAALKRTLENVIRTAVSGIEKGREESQKKRVLSIWNSDTSFWKELEALTASKELASYLSLTTKAPSYHHDDDTWESFHGKVEAINKELEEKDLLRYASVPTKVAREFGWFLTQAHPKQNLGEAKTLLFKRKKVVEIPVKRTWLEAITVVEDDKDGERVGVDRMSARYLRHS